MATTPTSIRGVITTLSVACMGGVCTITISDQTATARSTQTYRLLKSQSGAWEPPADLTDETKTLLTDLATRSDRLS